MRYVCMVIFILILCPSNSYGQEIPYIRGETIYNETVEEIINKDIPSPSEVVSRIFSAVAGEIRSSSREITGLIIMAVMSGAITLLSEDKKNAGSEAAFFCCFALIGISALKCFDIALQYGKDVIGAMTDFITKLSPLLTVMLIACGNSVSASVFHPVLASAIYVIGIIVDKILVPLCVFSAVLSVSGNIGAENRIGALCRVIGSINKWIMGAIVTVFTGISTIYGFNAPSLDAVAAKTMKFAAGTLVPVVGGFLSDTLETVISGSRVMKNAVGTAGVISVCIICLVPVIKIGVIHMMLRFASAVAETVADKRISAMLGDVAGAVGTIFALTVMSAVLFIINLCIILASTNFG